MSGQSPSKPLPVLIVEDNVERLERLRSLLPPDFRAVVATTAHAAIENLRRDPGRVYAGILLDHDLREGVRGTTGACLSGTEVAADIARWTSNEVPVLIHSRNLPASERMAAVLAQAGFSVTRLPIDRLSEAAFHDWTREVREEWESPVHG